MANIVPQYKKRYLLSYRPDIKMLIRKTWVEHFEKHTQERHYGFRNGKSCIRNILGGRTNARERWMISQYIWKLDYKGTHCNGCKTFKRMGNENNVERNIAAVTCVMRCLTFCVDLCGFM